MGSGNSQALRSLQLLAERRRAETQPLCWKPAPGQEGGSWRQDHSSSRSGSLAGATFALVIAVGLFSVVVVAVTTAKRLIYAVAGVSLKPTTYGLHDTGEQISDFSRFSSSSEENA